MKESISLIAFILLIVGTAGLLVNEFIFDIGRAGTVLFASCNIIGLVILAVIYFSNKSRKKEQEDR